MVSELLSFFPQGVVAFDLETTGLSPLFDKIIEIGAVKISPDKTTSHFQELVQPGSPIPPDNTLIHGITDAAVSDAPPLDEVLPRFIRFVGGASLVAHNAKFDAGFIVFALHQQKRPLPKNPIYCSLSLSRGLFENASNNRLNTLAELLSIPTRRHHRAWDDASTCLQLLSSSLQKLGDAAQEHLHKAQIDEFAKYRHIQDIPPHLSGLALPVSQKKSLDIKYAGGSTPGAWRPVTLQSLLPLPGGNVLYALCHRSNRYKFFFLKKIRDFRKIVEEA